MTVSTASAFDHIRAPQPGLSAAVVVPVRNEAAGLWRTLSALAAQVTTAGTPLDRRSYEVLVLANNCSDDSAAVVRAFGRDHPGFACHVAEATFPSEVAHVGHARRVVMDAASDRLLQAGSPRGVIASTDGDTAVAPDWLAATLDEIGAGADAVGGRILTARHGANDAGLTRWRRLDSAYRLARDKLVSRVDPDPADPWPRHHQHFCASLALRRDAYERIGGVPAVRFLEDEALVAALRRADLRVRHSPRVRVLTSGRHEGRVEVGLSWQLREWARGRDETQVLMVDDDGHDVARQARSRRALRALFLRHEEESAAYDALAASWQLPVGWLREQTLGAATFGALYEAVEARRPRHGEWAQIPVREAIDALHGLITRCPQEQPRAVSERSL